MNNPKPIYSTLALAGLLIVSLMPRGGAAEVEWTAEEGVLPEEASLGFSQSHSASGCLTMADGALVIHTLEDGGASVEFPITLSEPGDPLVVEVEARSDSDRDAAAIKILSDNFGISSWLFDKSHLRVILDGESEAKYFPVQVSERHVYRYEIDGVDIRVFIDGNKVFEGKLGEPLETPRLVIGDVSAGGGTMEIFRILIQYEGDAKNLGLASPSALISKPLVWNLPAAAGEIPPQNWPSEADGLVVNATYQAAMERQWQWFVLCEGTYGRQVVSSANRLASVAEPALRDERFFLEIPPGTRTISVRWTVAPSAIPFELKSLTAMPVEIIAKNESFERTSGLGNSTIGQSFVVESKKDILGVVLPFRRNFDERKVPSQISCQLLRNETEVEKWSLPAGEVARDYDGMAVFMSEIPQQVEGEARFEVDSGVAESRFFGWYNYDLSWQNPYQGGHLYFGTRAEKGSDITFYVLSGIRRG